MPRRLRPVDLAREHGLSAQAVRTYERDGVLPPAARTAGGHRTYGEVHARALRAFVALVPAHGHAAARAILHAVGDGDVEGALRLVDEGHDRLRRDRATLDTVAAAVGGLAGGPAVPALDDPLSVGELARRLGVVPATLRAWERAGILRPTRDRGGQRRYAAADVRDAELAGLLRRGGTGLPRIAVVVGQVRDAGGTAELAASLSSWRDRLTTRGRAMLAGAGALAAHLDGLAARGPVRAAGASGRGVVARSATMSGEYAQAYRRSIEEPEAFWGEAARLIDWYAEPTTIVDTSALPFSRWFVGGELNTCHNALDRHVEAGRGDQPALIHDSPVTQSQTTYTYAQLRDQVARFAGVLRSVGVGHGDRVVVYMPMVPEAVIAMLACARLGAVHSVVFGGFAARELAVRIDDARPSAIVSASCGIEGARVVEYKPLLDKAIELASHDPGRSIVLQRPQAEAAMTERDLDWAEAISDPARAEPTECVPVAATDPLYVLYTSGTTGKPKGVQRDNGGHAVALRWSMENVYDVGPGEVFFCASDVGWVVGHSYIVYAPLLTGATTVLYEGKPVGTPDAGQFWRVIAEHGVKALFTAPTAFRGIKKEDPEAKLLAEYDLSGFETLFLAGERLDPETYHWATDRLGVPVVDHWWQTETGWPIAANLRGLEPLELRPGSPSVPVPGYRIEILDVDGAALPAGEEGAIVIKLPLPPACLQTLWDDDERFRESYMSRYEGYYLTGDGGYLDDDGYVFVMGRTDDVINVAGHRLSTGSMEEVLAGHPDVAECAVIGVHDEMKGQVPRGFVVLKAGVERDEAELGAELVAKVRDEVGAVASFKNVAIVPALPKTRSGKVLRKTMRTIADGGSDADAVPSTIDDASVLDALRPKLTEGPAGG